jgi:hypothetical protein
VETGDMIVGTLLGGKDATGKFNYSCSLDLNGQHLPQTELPLVDIPELVYAVCVIESYDVTARPGDYPAGSIKMSSMALEVGQRPLSPINWTKSKKLGRDYVADPTTNGHEVDFELV